VTVAQASQIICLVMDSADSSVCFKEASNSPWYPSTLLHYTPSNPVYFHIHLGTTLSCLRL